MNTGNSNSNNGNRKQHNDRPRRRKRGGVAQGQGQQARSTEGHGGGQQNAPKLAPVLRKYLVMFYETHNQAKDDIQNLSALKLQCDQLNIVIKAEGNMDDPELTPYGRIYAGEAWHLIHKRRVDDAWYESMHE